MSMSNPNALMSMISQQQPHPAATQVQPTDVIGPIMAKWQGELKNAELKRQAQQALQGSAFGLLGSGASAWGMQGFPWKGTMLQKALSGAGGAPVGAPANMASGFTQGGAMDLSSLLGSGATDAALTGGADALLGTGLGTGAATALGSGAAEAGLAGLGAEGFGDLLPLLLLA